MMFRPALASRILRFCSAGKKPGQSTLTRTFLRGVFAGQILRQVDDRRLRRRIGEDPRQRQVRGDAADVEDRAALGLGRHVRGENLAAEVRRGELPIDDAVPLLVGDLRVGNGRVRPGAVDQHVALAELRQSLHRAGPAPTRRLSASTAETRFAAQRFDRLDPLVAALFAAARDDHRRACLGNAFGQAPPRTPVPPMTTATWLSRPKRWWRYSADMMDPGGSLARLWMKYNMGIGAGVC